MHASPEKQSDPGDGEILEGIPLFGIVGHRASKLAFSDTNAGRGNRSSAAAGRTSQETSAATSQPRPPVTCRAERSRRGACRPEAERPADPAERADEPILCQLILSKQRGQSAKPLRAWDGTGADCEQNKNMFHLLALSRCLAPMRISYLDRLNTEQRQAVEHGVGKANGQ